MSTERRTCWYQRWDGAKWRAGALLAWSTEYEELRDGGAGQFPVGLVEDVRDTRCVEIIYAKRICFAVNPPGETEL